MFANKDLIEALIRSKIYENYVRAFTNVTGMPVSLRSVDSWQFPHRGARGENPFCAMMAQRNGSCAACLRTQEQLSLTAHREPKTVTCHFGMTDSAVPVRSGENRIGLLVTGQVFTTKPTRVKFRQVAKQLTEWGLEADEALRDAYFATPVLSPEQYDGTVELLNIFAQQLSTVSNQVLVQRQNAEPPMITRAKEFIARNQGDAISLAQVAKVVNASTFYFCKMFKRATGLNFTDYVSRVRVEKAKNLLLNPNLRVSEIAFEVGFQSLTHFNRVFKNIVGKSPTEYRSEILLAA